MEKQEFNSFLYRCSLITITSKTMEDQTESSIITMYNVANTMDPEHKYQDKIELEPTKRIELRTISDDAEIQWLQPDTIRIAILHPEGKQFKVGSMPDGIFVTIITKGI